MTCLACGYQAQFLANHIRAAHADLGPDGYREKYPDALMSALNCENRSAPHNVLTYTVDDLKPFMDEDGLVIVDAAARSLDHCQAAIRSLCQRQT